MCCPFPLWEASRPALSGGATDTSRRMLKRKMQLRNKRVLITGGAGLIGSHIADQLIERDVAEIVILDNFVRGRMENLEQALPSGKITLFREDIRDIAAVAK